MFGGSKISSQEANLLKEQISKYNEFFASMDECKREVSSIAEEMEDAKEQSWANLSQIKENISSSAELAGAEVNNIATISYALGECANIADDVDKDFDKLISSIESMEADVISLAEENKHLTTPSRQLSDMPISLKSHNSNMVMSLDKMKACSKQMGVLALNAAIEAGRMGENGKSFVSAAEEIRVYSTTYDDIIVELNGQITEANNQIEKLNEVVTHLVSLLKDNSMATTKLLRTSAALVKEGKECKQISADSIREVKEQAVEAKNIGEEILKLSERNKLLADDLGDELKGQDRRSAEIYDSMKEIFDQAKRLDNTSEE